MTNALDDIGVGNILHVDKRGFGKCARAKLKIFASQRGRTNAFTNESDIRMQIFDKAILWPPYRYLAGRFARVTVWYFGDVE
ncbi:hypothetical protein D3C79_979750 [compost metagenome]